MKKSRCKLCAHPERARIEMMRIGGVSLDAIAAQFDLSRDAIWRHMARHVTEADKAAYLVDVPLTEMLARAADEGVGLLDHFRIVRATLMKQFQLAASVNDRRAVASLAGRLNETLGLLGNLTGEMLRLSPASVTNNTNVFLQSPAFSALQQMLLRKLASFPDALSAVVEGLQELEASTAPMAEGPALIDVTPVHVHGA